VLANGYVRVIFSHGSSADWDVRLPNFWYITGRIIDGALHVRVPGRGIRMKLRRQPRQWSSKIEVSPWC